MTVTSHRIVQYISIIVIFALLGGGYWYWKTTRAAQTVESDEPSFEAPLTHSLDLSRGIGTPTYSRSDGADRRATVTDFEGRVVAVKSGEARFEGARRVENLLVNSDLAGTTGTGYYPTSWSVTGNDINAATLSAEGTPVGSRYVVAIRETASGGYQGFQQSYVWNLNAAYTFSVYVRIPSGVTASNLYLYLGSATPSTVSVATASQLNAQTKGTWVRYSTTFTVTASTTNALAIINNSGATGTGFDVTAPQLELVAGQGNQNPSEYVSTNVKTSSPYHGAGVDGVKYFDTQNGNTVASNIVTEAAGAKISQSTLKGYLAEGLRTNTVVRSEEMDNGGPWSLTGLLAFGSGSTANATVSPDGKTTAEKIVEDGNLNLHKVVQAPSLTAGNTYTVSLYAKSAERTHVELYVGAWNASWVSSGDVKAAFNLSTTSVYANSQSSGFTYVDSTITDIGNGWKRCTMTFSIAGGTDLTNRQVGAGIHNGTTDWYTGDGSSGLYLWGAQLEQTTFASSYIPTTSGTVTRAADNLEYVGASNFNDTQGTVTVDVTTEWTGNGGLGSAYFIDDPANYQRMSIWHWNGSSNSVIIDRNGGNGTRNNLDSSTTITAGALMKFGQRWSGTAHSLFVSGSLKGSDTTLTLPYDAISGVAVGVRADGNEYAYANLKNVRAWKKALTDTELNNLTSLTQSTSDAAVKKTTATNAPSNTGLVGYWSFEDGTGTKAEDFSPSGTNTATFTNSPTWTTGRIGGGLSVASGTNATAPTASGINPGTTMTLSFWIRDSGTSTGYASIISKIVTPTSGWMSQRLDTTSDIYLRVDTSAGSNQTGGTIPGVLDGNWHHVVWILDNGIKKGYKDGSLIVNTTYNHGTGFSSAAGFIMGGQLVGTLDEVRLYNRALSSTEVADLHVQGGTARTTVNANQNDKITSGLVGFWSFNGKDLSGTTAYDRSGQGNNGTLTNGPSVYPGKVGQSLLFTGTNQYVDAGNEVSLQTSVFTFTAWVNPSGSDIRTILGSASNSGPQFRIESTNGGISLLKQNIVNFGASSGSVPNGSWSFVAVSYNASGDFAYYINGSPVGSGTNLQTFTFSNRLIGNRNTGGLEQFSGLIDEVRIYNRVLSTDEISELYRLGR